MTITAPLPRTAWTLLLALGLSTPGTMLHARESLPVASPPGLTQSLTPAPPQNAASNATPPASQQAPATPSPDSELEPDQAPAGETPPPVDTVIRRPLHIDRPGLKVDGDITVARILPLSLEVRISRMESWGQNLDGFLSQWLTAEDTAPLRHLRHMVLENATLQLVDGQTRLGVVRAQMDGLSLAGLEGRRNKSGQWEMQAEEASLPASLLNPDAPLPSTISLTGLGGRGGTWGMDFTARTVRFEDITPAELLQPVMAQAAHNDASVPDPLPDNIRALANRWPQPVSLHLGQGWVNGQPRFQDLLLRLSPQSDDRGQRQGVNWLARGEVCTGQFWWGGHLKVDGSVRTDGAWKIAHSVWPRLNACLSQVLPLEFPVIPLQAPLRAELRFSSQGDDSAALRQGLRTQITLAGGPGHWVGSAQGNPVARLFHALGLTVSERSIPEFDQLLLRGQYGSGVLTVTELRLNGPTYQVTGALRWPFHPSAGNAIEPDLRVDFNDGVVHPFSRPIPLGVALVPEAPSSPETTRP
ncbi:MAG: hypothetical protein H7831_14230 [Magnetococcus sp. WYHC-3]